MSSGAVSKERWTSCTPPSTISPSLIVHVDSGRKAALKLNETRLHWCPFLCSARSDLALRLPGHRRRPPALPVHVHAIQLPARLPHLRAAGSQAPPVPRAVAHAVLRSTRAGARPEGDANAVQLHLLPVVPVVGQLLHGQQQVEEQQRGQQQDPAQPHQESGQQRVQDQGAAPAQLFQGSCRRTPLAPAGLRSKTRCKLQALVYRILPPTTAITGYAIYKFPKHRARFGLAVGR